MQQGKNTGQTLILGVVIGAGAVVAIILGWPLLDPQMRSVITGGLFGVCGLIMGAAFALSVVAILLLRGLNWSVKAAQPPPVVIHGPDPQLPAPSQQFGPPSRAWNANQQRPWRVLGAEDAPDQIEAPWS